MHTLKSTFIYLIIISTLATSCAHIRKAPPKNIEEQPLLALVGPETPSNRTASLNMVEGAKRAINDQRYLFAQTQLETAIRVDGTNPYAYYYLAKTHLLLKNYKNAFEMLTRAQSLFGGTQPDWLSQCHTLEGQIYEDQGNFDLAEKSYKTALDLYPKNQQAKTRLKELGK